MKKIIACLGLFFSSLAYSQAGSTALDPTQVYNTGNIVLPTVAGSNSTPWVNGVYQDSLTCWAWGNPGYCGPNAIVRPTDSINFSYGLTNLYQVQTIASVLPSSGSGLRVNGYNFAFMAKNGNGWDDGRQDYLTAYVNFYDPKGASVFNKNYDLNSKFNWTYFNYSETFNTPFASKDLGSVQYGFVGKDNNFWAGPYGPEVYNVSFSLKYSVDPCAINVLSSPTCPGYMDALAKLSPSSVYTEPTTTTSTALLPPPPPPDGLKDPSLPPPPPPPVRSDTKAEASGNMLPPPNGLPPPPSIQNNVTASSPSTKENNVNGLAIGLSVVAKNQQKEQALALQTAQNAVAATEQSAQQAQQEAVNIASSSSANSASLFSNPVARQMQLNVRTDNAVQTISSSSINNSISLFTSPSSSQSRVSETKFSSSFQPVEILTTATTQTQSIVEQSNNGQQATALTLLPPTAASQSSTLNFTPIVQEVKNTYWQQNINSQVISTTTEFQLQDNQKFLTDRTNPISAIINEKNIESQPSQSSIQKASVNTNAANNDVAGGVDLNRMAVAPAGYNQYLNLIIADAAFYAPKEVYKNQRNVDNVRVLRSLSSDRLHQEMVDQQYRK